MTNATEKPVCQHPAFDTKTDATRASAEHWRENGKMLVTFRCERCGKLGLGNPFENDRK